MAQKFIRALFGILPLLGLVRAQVYDPNMPNLNGPSTSGKTTPAPAPAPAKPRASTAPAKTPAPAPKSAEPAKPVDPLSAVFSTAPIGNRPTPPPSASTAPTPAPLPGVAPTPMAPGALPGLAPNSPPGLGASTRNTRNPISVRTANDGEFVASTIKPSSPLQPGKGVSSRGERFAIVNYSLRDFLEYAWVLHPHQIEGGPQWMDKETYNLSALMPNNPRPDSDKRRRMTQTVVEKRFLLKFHMVKKDMPVYRMIVAPGGVKMTARPPDEAAKAVSSLGLPFAPRIPAKNVSMPRFAALLQGTVLDRPVIDQTGLTATYDFDLKWQANEKQFGGRGGKGTWHGDDKDPDLFTAIQSQLGLKLESLTMPVEIMVIDSASQPALK